MIASKGEKMSRGRVKSTGWAAFDLQQRQKDALPAQACNEPFPSLPINVTPLQRLGTFSTNSPLSVKPFSSVVLAKVDFPDTVVDDKKNKPFEIGSSTGLQNGHISQDNKYGRVFRQLKELYSWADDSLIEDIMAAAGNDFDSASSFLKAMVSDESSEKINDNMVVKSSCGSIELVSNDKTSHGERDISLEKISEPSKTCSVLNPCVGDDDGDMRAEFGLRAEKLSDDCMDTNKILGHLTCVPIEPEWEEDDIYLSCRKDAIKLMRAATRHSKAATNSFLRGDHYSAQQFSLKAQEEWAAAERLNLKAAREILSIRNENNGIWRLDLHGLHAVEAVQALQERLSMIETQVFSKGSSFSGLPNSFRTKAEGLQASSSSGFNNSERLNEQAFSGQKPVWLEVITGIGNHSRGGAALPAAVRSYLSDNGYRYDEARAGVIMVRPKIRHS